MANQTSQTKEPTRQETEPTQPETLPEGYQPIEITVDPRFYNAKGKPVDNKRSFAEWQITARESNWRFDSKNLKDNERGRPFTFSVPESETGYFFQYNGHTAFVIDIEKNGDNTTINYRNVPDIRGLKFTDNKITFDTALVKLRIPKRINKQGHKFSVERDKLNLYEKSGEVGNGEILKYDLYMMKGARFWLLGENPANETGNNFFKIMPDGNVKKIMIIRASSIEGASDDIVVSDAFYAGQTKTSKKGIRKPLIIANTNHWLPD